jgi:hypothetical protein
MSLLIRLAFTPQVDTAIVDTNIVVYTVFLRDHCIVLLLCAISFPQGPFATEEALASLRTLGLKTTLDWQGLVEVAASVQAIHTKASDLVLCLMPTACRTC